MRLLVTGGAGSLGSNIIENIGDECEEIVVVDNFVTGKRASLPPRSNVQLVEGSVVDAGLVNRVFSTFKPTHVIHSAAAYKDPNNWVEDSLTNVIGSINVVRAAEAHQVERLVNFQTALCYGRPTEVPIPVTHPLRPFTSYGISKTAGEAIILNGQTPSVSLRLANVTGPRLAIGPIPAFYKRLKANEGCSVSTTVRDFIDMSDFVSLLKLALKSDSPTGVFNVSTGEGHTIAEIFRLVAKHLGQLDAQPVAVNPPGADDVAEVVLDPSMTCAVFGWSAKVPFEETINKMLRWYDVHGITDVFSHLQEKK
jgi:nucleoside-diphosphate-sugar epimerase